MHVVAIVNALNQLNLKLGVEIGIPRGVCVWSRVRRCSLGLERRICSIQATKTNPGATVCSIDIIIPRGNQYGSRVRSRRESSQT